MSIMGYVEARQWVVKWSRLLGVDPTAADEDLPKDVKMYRRWCAEWVETLQHHEKMARFERKVEEMFEEMATAARNAREGDA